MTDEDVDDPTVLDNVLAWIGRIEQKLAANLVDMHSDIELMVELRGQDCGYYLVDHRARTIFWAETTFTHEVDLPDVSSPTHLGEPLSLARSQIVLTHHSQRRAQKRSSGAMWSTIRRTSVACHSGTSTRSIVSSRMA